LHVGLCSSVATKSRTSGVGAPENHAFPGRGGTRLPEMKRQELPYEMKSFDVSKDRLYVLVKDGIRTLPRP